MSSRIGCFIHIRSIYVRQIHNYMYFMWIQENKGQSVLPYCLLFT